MRPVFVTVIVLALFAATQAAAQTHLRHVGRYNTQTEYHDHLMGVERVGEHYALVCSNLDIALVDLEALPPEGTQALITRYTVLDVTNTVTIDDTVVYANLRLGGMAILTLDVSAPSLDLVTVIEEPNVFFERLCVVDGVLYMAAHSGGLRIYDLANPLAPVLVGSLEEGLTDAFAVAVEGDTAYVADGAGGLKIVDVTDVSSPSIIDGETIETSVGTSADVLVQNGVVYVAAGGAGLCVYSDDDLATRTIVETPVSAKQIVSMGDRLAVADIGSVRVFDIGPDGVPIPIAWESGQRRLENPATNAVTLRLWHGVGEWGPNRVLAANWDSLDVYEIVDASDQPDVTASTHRLRFAPTGGQKTVELRSMGGAPLVIDDVTASEFGFTTSLDASVVPPGQSATLTITYAGGPPGQALVLVHTNDPDESPLPIQVYGDTVYLDPTEPAEPFTLESWTFDHDTRDFTTGTFDMEANAGRIVYFHIFGLG